MRNFILALSVILIAVVYVGATGQWIVRVSDPKLVTAETGSYTYVENINVSSADWTIPDSVIVLGICVDSAGTIKVDLKEATGKTLLKPDAFCYPLRVTKIYKTGTDSLLRNGKIEVFGFKKN
jgi:uncharacterized membrane protein